MVMNEFILIYNVSKVSMKCLIKFYYCPIKIFE